MISDANIYILLPVHNRRNLTEAFVQCLLSQTCQNFHLVLIDDGSQDGTAEAVSNLLPPAQLSVVSGKGDWYWGGGLQQGYLWLQKEQVKADKVVLMINDDSEIGPEFLAKGMQLLDQHPNTLVQATTIAKDDPTYVRGGLHMDWVRYRLSFAKSADETNCLNTRGLFLRAGDFYKIGGFVPNVLRHYRSDIEFTLRAHRKGLSLLVAPELLLVADLEKTGIRRVNLDQPLGSFLRMQFTHRSSVNPLMHSGFILLASPWQWKLPNLLKVWWQFVRRCMQYFFHRTFNRTTT